MQPFDAYKDDVILTKDKAKLFRTLLARRNNRGEFEVYNDK